ncbi:MAG: efflux RND transporter periplasmic adaptor subunit [Thalassovita sp.]
MAQKKRSRMVVTLVVLALIGGALTYAFWPRPVLVDMASVTRAPMQVTIDEEGRTQVHEAYVVSTPIAGRLMRLTVQPGDKVTADTVVARMLPTSPAALDARSREQASTNVKAAEAALRVAEADVNKAQADRDLAEANLERTRRLYESDIASKAALETVERAARAANAALDTTRAAISMRIAELNNARAALISFDGAANGGDEGENVLSLVAPVQGSVLRIMQRSEITVPAGTPILEIGSIETDLEVVAELLSTDAVQIAPGDSVIIDNWGGEDVLMGTVSRIEPWGFTKVSALGVEEQRVKVTIAFTSPFQDRAALGHGFRVETRIITWTDDAALTVPAGALFRNGLDGWALFVIRDGAAVLTPVKVAANNGLTAALSDGVAEGDPIVLYPPAGLEDGQTVAKRSAYQ